MKTIRYTWWKDGDFYLGHLNDYPDYQTQGFSKEELMDNLKDILNDIESNEIPYLISHLVRKHHEVQRNSV